MSVVYGVLVCNRSEQCVWAASHFFQQNYPHIHLICVGQRRSVSGLLQRTYSRRITVVDVQNRSSTLGELRNMAIRHVPYDAIWIQIDDDDIRASTLVSEQYSDMVESSCDAITLNSQVHYDIQRNCSAISKPHRRSWHGMAGTIMVRKRRGMPQYPSLRRGEDSVLLRRLLNHEYRVCVWKGRPHSYIRVHHGFSHASDLRASARSVLLTARSNVWIGLLEENATVISNLRDRLLHPYATYMITSTNDPLVDAELVPAIYPKNRRVHRRTTIHPNKRAIHTSHLHALRTFLNSSHQLALILEDDVVELNRSRVASVVRRAPVGWTYINLGRCLIRNCSQRNQPFLHDIGLCRHAYLVTRRGASKLIRFGHVHTIPGDNLWHQNSDDTMFSVPTFVVQDKSIPSSYQAPGHTHPECHKDQITPKCSMHNTGKWTFCSREGGICRCNGQVRFGCSRWTEPMHGPIHCSVGEFGDPVPNTEKICQCDHRYGRTSP